jgi:hypothetical protein
MSTFTDLTGITSDAETGVMAIVAQYLEPLDADARDRVLMWAHARFHSHNIEVDGETVERRTIWLDELPTENDLVLVGGREVPVAYSKLVVEADELTYRLTVDLGELPNAEALES